MDVMAILALIDKGITVASVLISAAKDAGPALTAIKDLVTGAKQGVVTEQQLADTEALLDSLVADFNTDLPEA